MPVTKSRNGMHDMLSLDQTNTTRFLFGEDENAAPGSVDKYLNMNATDDKFPILVRRDEFPGLVCNLEKKTHSLVLTALCSFPLLLQH